MYRYCMVIMFSLISISVFVSLILGVKPEFPTAGGSGVDAQTVSFTFTVSKGAVVETFS